VVKYYLDSFTTECANKNKLLQYRQLKVASLPNKVENMDRGQVLPHRKEPLPIGDPGPHLIHGIDMQIQRDILNLNF